MKISVIIPSLNPDDKLVSVVDSLVKKGFEDIIIVNAIALPLTEVIRHIYGHLRKLAVIASVQYLPTRLIRVRAEV